MRQLLILISLVGIGNLMAADTTGSVRGSITDPSGAAIPDVQIDLVNEGTQVAFRQATGVAGEYVFNLVPPGSYTLKASKEGFQTYTVNGVAVEIDKSTLANVKLRVGAISQSVEVSAAADIIDTASAKASTNISEKYITDLPSPTRNPLSFAEMAPGVILVRPQSQAALTSLGTGANVNGQRQTANVYYLDGSDNTGSWRNLAMQFPNPDAVQEVQVSTANTSAEFGKQPGGIFNVITKSGTNDLHGSAFYFFHNENLNANSWNQNLTGTPRPLDDLKQGGGTLGGPIRRNKTFFFGSFMVYSASTARFQNTAKFLTPAMLGGDFSQFTRQIYDPGTGQPLPGNQIPKALLDPVTTKLATLLPTVANYGDRYNWSYSEPALNHEILGKVTHQFNAANQAEVSYLRTWGNVTYPGNDSSGNNAPAFGPETYQTHEQNISARHTWVAAPRVILQNRFSLAEHYFDRESSQLGRNLADFGAIWPDSQTGQRKYLPNLSVADGFKTAQSSLGPLKQHNVHFGSTLTWVRGSHNLKFGAEFQKDAFDLFDDQDQATFTFDGNASSKPAGGQSQGTGVFGFAAADFLMGRAVSFSTNGTQDQRVHAWSNFFFAQDEWRIVPRLTLTLGLRYEFYTPATENSGHASAFIPGHQSDLYPKAPLGIAFLGDKGVPSGFTQSDHNNFAPRVGLAYDPAGDGKTAIRAGFGVYYSEVTLQQKLFAAQGIPWASTATGGQTLNMVDPWGTSQTIKYPKPPTPFSSDVSTYSYPSVINNLYQFGGNFTTPYTLAWTASIERQLTSRVKLWTGYVASRGFSFVQLYDGNLPVWQANATLQNIQTRRPLPNYGVIRELLTRGKSWYDALQIAADARVAKGLTARFTYSYARTEDYAPEDFGSGGFMPSNPLNANGERGPEGYRNVARLFYIYDIPLLRGAHGWTARLLGNWQISGSVLATTGDPITVLLGQDYNFDGVNQLSGSFGDRPDLVGPIRYTSGSKDARAVRFFDPSAFKLPAARNVFGTENRNQLRGPGQWNSDLALLKNFPITERKQFQLRAEAYDFLNHNSLTDPNTNMASTDFTKILNRTGNRIMQIGLRFQF